jgi:phage protein D
MSKYPYYKIFVGEKQHDISSMIENFRFEESVKEDNMLEITVKTDSVQDAEKEIVEGSPVVFQFGYIEGKSSEFHTARITDISVRYAERITMKVVALDKGTVLKKLVSNRVWKNITTSEIVKKIAAKYNLLAVVDEQGRKWESLPQGNLSDFEFLQQLAEQESGGNFICFVNGSKLYFVRRGFDKPSKVTFKYGSGASSVISFEPKQKASDLKAGSSTTSVGADALKKEAFGEKVDPGTEDKSVELGKHKIVYDEYGEEIGFDKGDGILTKISDKVFSEMESLGKRVITSHPEKDLVKNIGNSRKKEGTLKAFEATLTVAGTPDIRANEVITVTGVLPRHQGNYLVRKVTHNISPMSGYISVMELAKNANDVEKKNGVESTNANKTVGKDVTDPSKVTLTVYDADGNEIATKSESEYIAPK